MHVIVHLPGRHFRPGFGRSCHEIVVRLCRAFSHRCPVNCLAVQPGLVADPNRLRRHASPRRGRCAEAGGKAASSGARDKHGSVSPNLVNHADVIVSRTDPFLCAGLTNGEDCQPGESRQQLQRWLCIKLPERQGSLGWMQLVGRQHRLRTFLANLPRHHHPQILPGLRRNEDVPGRQPKQGPLALQQPGRRQQVQGRRAQAASTPLNEARAESRNRLTTVAGPSGPRSCLILLWPSHLGNGGEV